MKSQTDEDETPVAERINESQGVLPTKQVGEFALPGVAGCEQETLLKAELIKSSIRTLAECIKINLSKVSILLERR